MLGLLSALPREHGVATVLVTHDARVAGYADRVLEMRDGRLSEHELGVDDREGKARAQPARIGE